MQLIDDGGFADSGIAGNQHQLRPAAGDDAIKRREEGLDLARSPVQFLGNDESILSVVFAWWEIHDPPVRFPFGEAASKVTLHAQCRLVAVLGSLGEQLHHDRRDTGRHACELAREAAPEVLRCGYVSIRAVQTL